MFIHDIAVQVFDALADGSNAECSGCTNTVALILQASSYNGEQLGIHQLLASLVMVHAQHAQRQQGALLHCRRGGVRAQERAQQLHCINVCSCFLENSAAATKATYGHCLSHPSSEEDPGTSKGPCMLAHALLSKWWKHLAAQGIINNCFMLHEQQNVQGLLHCINVCTCLG
jgi:hypothetical protein